MAVRSLTLTSTHSPRRPPAVPLEGLKSQAAFDEMRQSYIRELTKAIHQREKGMAGSSQLFYHLTKLMDSMHEVRFKPYLTEGCSIMAKNIVTIILVRIEITIIQTIIFGV